MKIRNVLLRQAAETDLIEAYQWYRSINAELAERLLVDLETATDRISAHPHSCPVYLGTVRRLHLRVFPYTVYHRLERTSTVVHAILHNRRSPKLHRKRAK